MVLLSACGFVAVAAIACVGSDPVLTPTPGGGDGSSGGSSSGDALPPDNGVDGSSGSTSSSGSTDSGPDAPALLPCRQATSAPLPNDLIAQWPFQNAELVDLTGLHSQATSISLLGKVPDRFGCAESALGVENGNGVELGKPNNILTTAFTIQLWVRWMGTTSAARIFGNELSPGGNDNGTVGIYHDKTNLILTAIYGTSAATLTFTGFAVSSWHHIVATITATQAQLFVNGELIEQKSFTGLSVTTAAARSWRLGQVKGGTLPFKGSIDDVRVYSRAISSDDVKTLYKEHGWPP